MLDSLGPFLLKIIFKVGFMEYFKHIQKYNGLRNCLCDQS